MLIHIQDGRNILLWYLPDPYTNVHILLMYNDFRHLEDPLNPNHLKVFNFSNDLDLFGCQSIA